MFALSLRTFTLRVGDPYPTSCKTLLSARGLVSRSAVNFRPDFLHIPRTACRAAWLFIRVMNTTISERQTTFLRTSLLPWQSPLCEENLAPRLSTAGRYRGSRRSNPPITATLKLSRGHGEHALPKDAAGFTRGVPPFVSYQHVAVLPGLSSVISVASDASLPASTPPVWLRFRGLCRVLPSRRI